MATATLKKHFRAIKRGHPGHRFQDHYEHQQHARNGRVSAGRIWMLALGVLAILVGIVLCVIPGPGLPFIFIGGGLLAAESKVVARAMDWLEVHVRAVWRWGKRHWDRLPLWGKIVVGGIALAASVGGTWFGWRLLHG